MINQRSETNAGVSAVEEEERRREAVSRGNCYGLLALVFRDVPTPDVVAQLRAGPLAEALDRLECDVALDLAGDLEIVTERLRQEYTRIFVGPGSHVSLYASVHHPDEGQLWGESTVRVKRFIEATGLSFNDNWDSIPDHIAIELELMQKLCEREAEAWALSNSSDARLALKIEKQFLREHLVKWIPCFCEKALAVEPNPFYRQMCGLTKTFVCSESNYVSDLLASIDMDPLSIDQETRQPMMTRGV